jgi:DNA-binding Lrp family transcriptional regulator
MLQVNLDEMDKKILVSLQGDLGEDPEPYATIAQELGIDEAAVIERIKRMKEEGVIRRLGAMIRHIEAGIGFNGMVVWTVDPDRVEEAGNHLASFEEVTHCYERPPFSEKGGTLFTMAHAASKSECLDIVRRMADHPAILDHEILFSERELKKVSMVYFDEE